MSPGSGRPGFDFKFYHSFIHSFIQKYLLIIHCVSRTEEMPRWTNMALPSSCDRLAREMVPKQTKDHLTHNHKVTLML